LDGPGGIYWGIVKQGGILNSNEQAFNTSGMNAGRDEEKRDPAQLIERIPRGQWPDSEDGGVQSVDRALLI